MSVPGFSQEFVLEALQAISGADTTKYGFLVGAKLDLCTINQTYNGQTPLGNCTAGVANYTGYAQQTLTWNKPSLSADGSLELVSGSATFRPTGSTTVNTVYGFYSTLSNSGSLGFAGPLDGAPIAMASAVNLIELVVRVRISPSGIVVQVS